ncbi:OprD family outer membrane porin, partial [Klebsiella pneumoniae]|uniref:OprD family outer membrane porin n=1 Tax=Klebsiella pneumoniae TaxID=573 RepID=UPI003A96DB2F
WLARYTYDFAAAGVAGLNFSVLYLKGDSIDTAYADQGEWERDIALSYVTPSGPLKGLGVAWKNASLRSGLPAGAVAGSAT